MKHQMNFVMHVHNPLFTIPKSKKIFISMWQTHSVQNLTWIDEVTCVFFLKVNIHTYATKILMWYRAGGILTQTIMEITNNEPFVDCHTLQFIKSSEFWNMAILKSFRWGIVELILCVCVFTVLMCIGSVSTDYYSSFI